MTRWMNLQPKDVVILPIQIKNNQIIKNRPALIISKNLLHQNSEGFLFLPITSIESNSPYMISIPPNEIKLSNLEKNLSKIIIDKMLWERQGSIIKKTGSFSSDFFSKIMHRISRDVLELCES